MTEAIGLRYKLVLWLSATTLEMTRVLDGVDEQCDAVNDDGDRPFFTGRASVPTTPTRPSMDAGRPSVNHPSAPNAEGASNLLTFLITFNLTRTSLYFTSSSRHYYHPDCRATRRRQPTIPVCTRSVASSLCRSVHETFPYIHNHSSRLYSTSLTSAVRANTSFAIQPDHPSNPLDVNFPIPRNLTLPWPLCELSSKSHF